jgi:cytochrome c biogenesis factor
MNNRKGNMYPWIRLIKLDLSLLAGMSVKAYRHAGIRSIPILLTSVLFSFIVVISGIYNMISPGPPGGALKPWMVRYQFSFTYCKKVIDSYPQ